MRQLPDISKWSFSDVSDLPFENEIYEYKSSEITFDKLKTKISIAASAFWNSGGGIFIVGVNDNGEFDGGIPNKCGRQNIRDWADLAVKQTEPLGKYQVCIIDITNNNNACTDTKVVLVIRFDESVLAPHMAHDKKYYLRVGAHSEGASHFLVEALRSMKSYTKPYLKGLMQFHHSKPKIVELVIAAVNDAVALDVEITFSPFPKALQEHFVMKFPLKVAFIDKTHPFSMDISLWGARSEVWGEGAVDLVLKYKDGIENEYTTRQSINPENNFQPMVIGYDKIAELTKAIEKLAAKL